MAEPTTPRPLTDLACAYTQGTLAAWEVASFEDRLAVDQEARDALVIAVQAQAGPDAGSLRPDPAYRQEVIRRLAPWPWWAWLGRVGKGVRARAGWLGALAALVLVLFCGLSGSRESGVRSPESAQLPTPDSGHLTPDSRLPAPGQPAAVARFWADLPRSDHLVKAVEEETARRQLHLGGGRPYRPDATVFLQPEGPMMP